MTARPVPLTADPHVMYLVMTAEPIGSDDLVPPPPLELLRHYGSSEAALRRLVSRRHQHVLMASASLADAAFTARDLRMDALHLAEEHDGIVIDLAIPRILEQPARDVSLSHATQWYVVDYAELDAGRVATVGLSTFGLPELVMTGVDTTHHAMSSAVLAGLVHRLIAQWPADDPVGRATVTLRDIAYGLGDTAAETTPDDRTIDLDVAYDTDAHLLVVTLLADPAVTLFAP